MPKICEIFSAGCAVCDALVYVIKGIAGADCSVAVLDMHKPQVADRAKALGIRTVPRS